MTKIMIDAGHGGADPGAVYNGRQEKDDNLNLALAVGRILEEDGYEVEYTRTKDLYQTPYEKAELGNGSGADLFVSIHRNSGSVPGQYNGVQTLVYAPSGIKLLMAENINEELEKAGFQNLGVEARPDLAVLRRTRMPAVLVEAGFINSEEDNRIFDEKFQETAQAIADGILKTIQEETGEKNGIEGMDDPQKADPVWYTVQTGAFRNRQDAWRMLYGLMSQGFPVYMTEGNGYYRVRVGLMQSLDEAIQMEQMLRHYGYSTWLAAVM